MEPVSRRPAGRQFVCALIIVLATALVLGSSKAQAQPVGIQIPLAASAFSSPASSELADLNVLYQPAGSEQIRRAMLATPWTGDEQLDRQWLARIAAGQMLADHGKLLAIQGLQPSTMADVAAAYLIEAIDVVRAYRVTGEGRAPLRNQMAVSLLANGHWRSSDVRAKQEIAERLAYATMFIRELAEQSLLRADPELAERLRAHARRQVLEIFRIDLAQARIDNLEGLRARQG